MNFTDFLRMNIDRLAWPILGVWAAFVGYTFVVAYLSGGNWRKAVYYSVAGYALGAAIFLVCGTEYGLSQW
jgi:hypothetical protein